MAGTRQKELSELSIAEEVDIEQVMKTMVHTILNETSYRFLFAGNDIQSVDSLRKCSYGSGCERRFLRGWRPTWY